MKMYRVKRKSPRKAVQIFQKGRLGGTLYILFANRLYPRTLVRCDPLYIDSMNSQSSKSSSRLNLFKEILSLQNFLFRCYRLFQANHPQFFHLFRFATQLYDAKELHIFKSVFSFSVTVNRFDHICLQQSLNQIRCCGSLQIERFHDRAPAKDTMQSECPK